MLHIKQLVFADGLTLAGVRRRIDEEAPPVLEEAEAAPIKELLGRNAKERLAEVKRGLMSILEMLNARPGDARAYAPRHSSAAAPRGPRPRSRAAQPARPQKKARTPYKPSPGLEQRRNADNSRGIQTIDQWQTGSSYGGHPRRPGLRVGGLLAELSLIAHYEDVAQWIPLALLAAGLVALAVDLGLARGWTQFLVQITMVLIVAAGAWEYTFIFTAVGNFSSRWTLRCAAPRWCGTCCGRSRRRRWRPDR